jgi:hypothetical protein
MKWQLVLLMPGEYNRYVEFNNMMFIQRLIKPLGGSDIGVDAARGHSDTERRKVS